MKENNVIRTTVMGKNPHTVYSVGFHDSDGNLLCVDITEPTLDALAYALGDNFILQSEIEVTITSLESAGRVMFTDEAKLAFARDMALRAITIYDTSSNVNSFYLQKDKKKFGYWLNAETRNHLVTSVTSWSETHDEYTLDLRENNVSFSMPCNTLLQLLSELENYAVACYNVTSAHMLAVNTAEDIESIVNYDIASDYPEKLTFTV